MNNRGLIGKIIIGGVLLIVGFFWFVSEMGGEDEKMVLNESCVPASCCHPTACVWESERPDCSDVFCTMECVEGSMDCGAGRCEVVDGSCEVFWNE